MMRKENCMKKYISIILTISFLFALLPSGIFADVSAAGSNVSTAGVRELPDANIFEDEGTVFLKDAYAEWLVSGTPEVLVMNMLTDNVAFVVNSKYCWNKTKREEMTFAPVYNENGEMLIPASSVTKIFNVKIFGEYATEKQILSVLSGWEAFTDPRGFMIFSKNIDSIINKNIAVENNASYRHYRSYYDIQACIGKITWNDVSPSKDDWALARKKVYNALTLPENCVIGSYEEKYIKELTTNVKNYISKMTLDEETLLPFSDTTLYQAFVRIVDMARLYSIERDYDRNDIDRQLLKNSCIDLFNFLQKHWIGRNKSMDSNWFYNRITYPLAMANFMIMFYDELGKDRINEVAADLMVRTGSNLISNYQVPFKYYTNGTDGEPTNSYSNYTNLLWQTATNYTLYLLVENTERINDVLKYSTGIFEVVRNSSDLNVPMIKDGVYSDGSFVFHGWYPYNVGYGYSYVGTLGPMVAMTSGTVFDYQNIYGFSRVYDWIEKSWMPFVYANARIKITGGREKAQGLSGKGNVMVKSLLLIAQNAKDSNGKEKILQLLKPLVDEYYNDYIAYERVPIIYFYVHPSINAEVRGLLDHIKNNVEATPVEPYNYSYYNMDKFVHKRDDYTFMLSMSSERIDKYEAINNEGYTDWYIADGMTYLMQDSTQYIIDWWSYVDRYAIPGTTVDSQVRSSTASSYGTIRPNNSWAGGASDGRVAVAAMKLPSVASSKSSYVEGTKSYFMLDDRIICMGTGISGGKGEVYTTVENYKDIALPPDNITPTRKNGYTTVSVDGKNMPYTFDEKSVYENPEYISINNDRGWIFFGENNVSVERVVKNKGYAGLDKTVNQNAYDVPFITVKIHHGTDPENQKYGYIIVPSKSESEIKSISENPGFEVVEQSDERHIIKLVDGTFMANLFVASELNGFKFKNPCSVIMKPNGDGWKLYVAEPTQKLKMLVINTPEEGLAFGDSVKSEGKNVYVSVGRDFGSTYEINFAPFSKDNTTSTNLLWSAETDFLGNSTDYIRTWDMNLTIGNGPVSTKLYAQSLTGNILSYSISNTQDIKGIAYVNDNRLFYIPNDTTTADVVKIKVSDLNGNSSEYTITFELINE